MYEKYIFLVWTALVGSLQYTPIDYTVQNIIWIYFLTQIYFTEMDKQHPLENVKKTIFPVPPASNTKIRSEILLAVSGAAERLGAKLEIHRVRQRCPHEIQSPRSP